LGTVESQALSAGKIEDKEEYDYPVVSREVEN
jgi:hypothetical protein